MMDKGPEQMCSLAESQTRMLLADLNPGGPLPPPAASAAALVRHAVSGGGAAGGAPQLPAGGQVGGPDKHSRFLMPLIHCIRDKLSGGEGRANAPPFPYAAMREAAEGAGFRFNRIAACYAAEWRLRGTTEESLRLRDGHAPGWRQEELLFPPPRGQSSVPQAVYCHLELLVTQMANNVPLNPTVEGLQAVDEALLQWTKRC